MLPRTSRSGSPRVDQRGADRRPGGDDLRQAFLGANPGLITLIANPCGCGPIRVRPSTVAHETGHALGFWHVRDDRHIMASGRQKECPISDPTIDEQLHARIAYTRAAGNKDPDEDVNSGALIRPGRTGSGSTGSGGTGFGGWPGGLPSAGAPVSCFAPTLMP